MEVYYANTGPKNAVALHGTVPDMIGVFGAGNPHIPIGVARHVGITGGGGVLWKLTIGDVELPGFWILFDREFKLAA